MIIAFLFGFLLLFGVLLNPFSPPFLLCLFLAIRHALRYVSNLTAQSTASFLALSSYLFLLSLLSFSFKQFSLSCLVIMYLMATLELVQIIKEDDRRLSAFIQGLMFGWVLSIVLGLVESSMGLNFTYDVEVNFLSENISYARNFISVFWGNPNAFSTYATLCLTGGVLILVHFGRALEARTKRLYLLLIYSQIMLIVWNASRGAMLYALAILIYAFLKMNTRAENRSRLYKLFRLRGSLGRFLFLAVPAIALYIISLKNLDPIVDQLATASYRFNSLFSAGFSGEVDTGRILLWSSYLTTVTKNIFFGLGIGNPYLYEYFGAPHNLLLEILGSAGLLGIILCALFLAGLFPLKALLMNCSGNRPLSWLGILILGFGLSSLSVVNSSMLFSPLLYAFIVMYSLFWHRICY